MNFRFKFSAAATVSELLPLLIQLFIVAAILIITLGDLALNLVASVISIIWLQGSAKDLPQQFGELRLFRALFRTVGSWLQRNDAEEIYDRAVADYLGIEPSLEADETFETITAVGISDSFRSLGVILLYGYLLTRIGMHWLGQ